MVEIDEADLVMFFEEMPEEQSQEDIEFWNAPNFRKTVDGVTIDFAYSFSHKDLHLSLERNPDSADLLSYILREVVAIKIEQDVKGRAWLHATDTRHRVSISVQPSIAVIIANDHMPL